MQFSGSVQWDNTYVAVFDQLMNEFYRYTIRGTKATLKNTITLATCWRHSDCDLTENSDL